MAQEPKPAPTGAASTIPGAGTGAGAAAPRPPKLRYQDRPEISETFTDSIKSCIFDGQVMRIEFTVARFDEPGVLGVLEGRQVPVSRLVLSRTALNDLMGRLAQLGDAIRRSGAAPGAPAAPPAPATSAAPTAGADLGLKPTKQ